MLWVWLFLGPAAWLIALLVGAYRQLCMILEIKYHGLNTPMIWQSTPFRRSTWIIVATLSLISSATFAETISWIAPKSISFMGFGLSLVFRFYASQILASVFEEKRRRLIRNYPTISEQRRREMQDKQIARLEWELKEAPDERTRRRLLRQFRWSIDSPHAVSRWTTKEIDQHIAWMEEGRPLPNPELDPEVPKEVQNATMKVVEEERDRDKEIAQILFSSLEAKEILRVLKKVRASRRD